MTIAAAANVGDYIIKRLVNHTTDNDVTGGYIRTEMETLREATEKISAYIMARVNPGANVVQIHQRG
ncbi:hypothetical protein D5085_02715 [Ectothiorhodospiraceae bacterium BW-2]|nr:hypothetical protein D5085_02715 [Ectothiorhodospiraceae bacterium BW-2]